MSSDVPFSEILRLLESKGWTLTKIWEPYRVSEKPDRLPIMVRVTDRKVDAGDVAQIKSILEKEQGTASAGD